MGKCCCYMDMASCIVSSALGSVVLPLPWSARKWVVCYADSGTEARQARNRERPCTVLPALLVLACCFIPVTRTSVLINSNHIK